MRLNCCKRSYFYLLTESWLKSLLRCCSSKKFTDYCQIYDKGKDKLESDFNLREIILKMREIKKMHNYVVQIISILNIQSEKNKDHAGFDTLDSFIFYGDEQIDITDKFSKLKPSDIDPPLSQKRLLNSKIAKDIPRIQMKLKSKISSEKIHEPLSSARKSNKGKITPRKKINKNN